MLTTETAGEQRRALGLRGEELAVAHLQRLGYEIVARNVRTRCGEIDVIARREQALAFVEVKTRRVRGAAMRPDQQPLPWLRHQQRARIRRQAAAWLAGTAHGRPRAALIRFDAIGVIVDRHGRLRSLDHIEGAW